MILSALAYYQPVFLSLKMSEDKKQDKKIYDRHQQNQKGIALLAGLSYAAYVVYMHGGFFGLFNSSGYHYRMDMQDKMADRLIPHNNTHTNLFEYSYSIPF